MSDGVLSDTATLTFTTTNSPPVANAGADQTAPVGTLVTLSGAGSSDVDGDALTYAWTIVDAPANSIAALSDPASVGPTFVIDRAGT